MSPLQPPTRDRLLLAQLRWFVRLRWLAGGGVVVGSLIDLLWLHWYSQAAHWYSDSALLAVVGLIILAYNAALGQALRRSDWRRLPAALLVWSQILPDLVCLTALVVWTGGVRSPVLGFYFFHMVLSSLLLSQVLAYAAAFVAVILLLGGLWATGQIPRADVNPLGGERMMLAGWGMALVLAVFLANQITWSLRRHQRRLLMQNRRVRALAERLRQQQRVMVQHEKMVALGQMAAGVAHEINNPLANMDSLLQLTQRQPGRLTPEHIDTLRQQVARIRKIVQQMTSFAHPTELSWEDVVVNDVVEESLQMVRFSRGHQSLDIERAYHEPGCIVRAQPHALQQALVNVLINALHAMADTPQPRLVVRTFCDGGECRISIIDNGKGIPPEHMSRLFEPFFTTKPVGQGTGLGLAITYSLVQNQGGRIEVASEPEKGTTITFVLPRKAALVTATVGESVKS